MKKVLILTYYWPPSGGGGVHRNLKYAKYFRDFGWEPVIYTPEDAEYPSIDESLFQDIPENLEVVKRPIWEPYKAYRRFVGLKKDKKIYNAFISEEKKLGRAQQLAIFIRGNFFIPDARKFWIKPSIRFLNKYLEENPVDAVISSGTPHSMHLIGHGIWKRHKLPWVADFRDPWTKIQFFDQLKLTKWAENKHKRLEQKVLRNADQVVTVSWSWGKDFEDLGVDHCEVITNGYDPEDFQFEAAPDPDKFDLSHIGSISDDRNPPAIWEALSELCEESPSFKEKLVIRLVGNTDYSVKKALENKGLMENADIRGFLPHKEVLKMQKSSQVLLLFTENTPNVKGHIPGKLFEYLASERPIFAVGPPEGDSARILKETGAGWMCGFEEKEQMKSVLRDLFAKYQSGSLKGGGTGIERYSRKQITGSMAEVLNRLVKG